jgi:hypothetical protein
MSGVGNRRYISLVSRDANADPIEVSEHGQSIDLAKDSFVSLTISASSSSTADAAIFVHGLVGKLHAGDHG